MRRSTPAIPSPALALVAARALALAALVGLVASAPPARAQQVQWIEPTVTIDEPTPGPAVAAPGDEGYHSATVPLEEQSATVQELGGPLDYEQVLALNRVASSSIVPVRATFERDPLLTPSTVQVEGVATLVERADGSVVLVTAFTLVDGASAVEAVWQGETITVEVDADARFGLAALEPTRPLADPPHALPLLPVGPETHVETFSTTEGSNGAALGAGEAQYGYYQVSTLGVTLGYPLINRRGELVGVGSHRYPADPAFALAVPAGSVAEFLDAVSASD